MMTSETLKDTIILKVYYTPIHIYSTSATGMCAVNLCSQ